jgi:hypothetical protein
MTCVCSVGLDMIAVPGDTTAETISAIIADEAAIGVVNGQDDGGADHPLRGKSVGDEVLRPACWARPRDAGEHLLARRLHRPRRTHPPRRCKPQELGARGDGTEKIKRITS